jgi:hypothetical protein
MSAAATRVAEAELVFPDLVSQFDTGNGYRCSCNGLEAVHGGASSLTARDDHLPFKRGWLVVGGQTGGQGEK